MFSIIANLLFCYNIFAKLKGRDIIQVMNKISENISFEQTNEKNNKYLGMIFLIAGFAVFLFSCSQGLGKDIWYDEIFSLKFSELSFGEIVSATAKDVHPPFYYWYLKLVQGVLAVICPGMHPFVAGKVASMLPFSALFLYGITLVRKRFGWPAAGVFLFLITAMPQLSNYIVEVRMYSLALFFITAFFLHAVEAVCENRRRDFAFLFVYGILTAYTQYYACIAIAVIYICLLIFQLAAKNRCGVRRCLICIGLSVLCYLPWLPKLWGQLQTVRQSYWIQPLTFRSIFGCLKYVFLPVSFDGKVNYFLAFIMIAVCFCLFLSLFGRKSGKLDRWMGMVGILVPLTAVLTGFMASALGRPVFIYRYLIPGLGVSWFAVAVQLVKQWKRRFGVLLLLPFLLAGFFNMKGFYAEEHKKNVEMSATGEFLQEIPEEAVILTNFNHVQALMAAYLPNSVILYGTEPEPLIQELLPNCESVPAVEESTELKQLVQENDVYFLGSFQVRDELLKQWENMGIGHREEGSFLLERYWFNVYHLSMNAER